MTAIDTHAHVYPADYLDFLVAHGGDEQATKVARNLRADATDDDLQARIAGMDRAEVQYQVLAVSPQVPSLPDPADSLAAAQMINDIYADIVRRYPQRFVAYGALPLPYAEQSTQEITRIFDELGFVGVTVTTLLTSAQTGSEPLFLDDPRLDPIWEALDARGAVVNVHPTGSGALSQMIGHCSLEWVNGAPVEDATAVLHLLKGDVPRRFPKIRFHIAHLGGGLSFLARRIEDNYESWGAFNASPLQQMREMFYDAANFHEPALRLAAETFGVERILGGSDFPYFQDDHYVRAFDYIRSAALEDDSKQLILRTNAENLFGLGN